MTDMSYADLRPAPAEAPPAPALGVTAGAARGFNGGKTGMWPRLLSRFLDRLIRHGCLTVVFPDGTVRHFGHTVSEPVTVRLRGAAVARRLLMDPELQLGEAYMEGALDVDGDDIDGLLMLLESNRAERPMARHHVGLARLRRGLRGLAQLNPVGRARSNAAHHYDLPGGFYDLFLDADRQYSCAYFRHPGDSLETAQADKKALIATKLLLEPGHRVLDIGCGWGGLALHLARGHGVDVTGVTLSREQHRVAERCAGSAGLASSARFRLQDYRQVTGVFDRIVSVGMFEHVGAPHYRDFFWTLRDRLAKDGVAVVHTIGRPSGPGATNPWIAKHIFPGGYAPALSEILGAAEASGLVVTDVEVLRLHYAETLKAWRARFEANLDAVRALYDERFCRMWRFYLASSEVAFRTGGHVVFQLQLGRGQEVAPLTRDYLAPQAPAMPAEPGSASSAAGTVSARSAHRGATNGACAVSTQRESCQ